MSLRKKVFLYILVTIVFLILLMSLTSNYLALKAFEGVERRFFEQDMARVQSRLDEELRIVGRYAFDWGAWDSMYFFLEKKDLPSFQEMLDPMSLRALGLDILAVVDPNLSPVVAYTVTETGGEEKLSPGALAGLKALAPDLLKATSDGYLRDILPLGDDLYLLGVSPILLTNHMGPPRGFLLTGTALKKKIPEIAASLGTGFSVVPAPEAGLLRARDEVEVTTDSSGMATVRQHWRKFLDHAPSLEIRLTEPREIYTEGRRAILHSYLWIFLSGGGILVLVMILLDTMVLTRLDGLRSVSERIVSGGGMGIRVPVSGNDEITILSSSFNTLLDTLENLVAEIPDPLFICDPDGRILTANREAHRVMGIETKGLLSGTDIASIVKPAEVQKDNGKDPRTDIVFSSKDVFEADIARPDRDSIPVEIRRQEIRYGKRSLVLFLARDLTERKGFEQRLARKAYFDDLTGLPNRLAFIEDLNRVLKDGNRNGDVFCAAVLNLDRFKLINEQVGNVNGDRILLLIGRRLEEAIVEGTRLYRTGGNEFSLLIPFSPPPKLREEAESLMAKIHKAIGVPCPVGSETIFPSASIGVLTDISRCLSSSEVINRIQQALKEAKKAGLGFTSYYFAENDPSGPETVNILRLSAEMHAGMERGEFVPFFQPIYFADSGAISGFETLARWMHPSRGLLPPSEFIPMAEHTGFVGKIDLKMMEHALRAAGILRRRNPLAPPFFSSNGSPLFFRMPFAEEILENFLTKTGADPSLFTLEVTESLLIENLGEVSRKLNRLKELGIRIALDDFGTGYSSLQYINQLPFDYVKLDKSFVARLFESEKDERLLRTIIHMAGELRLEVIAEGVETQEQLEWLTRAGCAKVQGYLFSRPVPWEDVQIMMGGEESL
ncbi:MAG: EAL domain-containing protein [Aminivibrio sp.]|nr:EAL domain-containing protein [Aminivibrio sp.]